MEERGIIKKMCVTNDSNIGSSFWRSEIDIANDEDGDYESEDYDDEENDDEENKNHSLFSDDDFDAYSDGLGKGKKLRKQAADTYKYINSRISKFYLID